MSPAKRNSPCTTPSSNRSPRATCTTADGPARSIASPTTWQPSDRSRRVEETTMQDASSITPQSGDLILIVGTVKGVFIFSCDRNRREFKIAGPYFKGQAVFSTAFFQDSPPRIPAGHMSMHWGSLVSWSDNFAASWHEPPDGNVKFPAG